MNQNFFKKYHLKIETRNIVEKQTMRHYNFTMLKYFLWDHFQNYLQNLMMRQRNRRGQQPCIYWRLLRVQILCSLRCLYTERDFNAFEIKEFVLEIWKGTGKIYCQRKIDTPVTLRRLINDDVRDKSLHNMESISSSGFHAFVFIQVFFNF